MMERGDMMEIEQERIARIVARLERIEDAETRARVLVAWENLVNALTYALEHPGQPAEWAPGRQDRPAA